MILKIETIMGFVIWDNIETVNVQQGCIFTQFDENFEGNKGEKLVLYQYGTKEFHAKCDEVFFKDDKIKNPNFEIVTAYKDSLESFTIAFDTRAYLTNDDGKTIERL